MPKSKYEKLQEKILLKQNSAWFDFTTKEKNSMFSFCEKYKKFLDEAKTEREATILIIKLAKVQGFKDINSFNKLSKGDKFFYNNKGKSVVLGVIGKDEELNFIGSHIDAPRIDLKPKPFYESNGLALMKTHYYGGIKKYHWFNTPLAIHGVVFDKKGNKKTISIGEKDDEPLFVISDLLPHLGRKQAQQPLKEAFSGETLNLIVGNIPIAKDDKIKDKIKLNVLSYINEKYGVTEEDFVSAEIELVPVAKARDVGFDRGLISAYGQDDRVCAFSSLKALFSLQNTKKTCIAAFFDKEEIGSVGNTGAASQLFELVVEMVLKKRASKKSVNEIISKSNGISADVVAALNPSFPEVHDPLNAPLLGNGIAIEKHTGYGGKYAGSDANAEYVSFIIRLLKENKINWQPSELGKVDEGGGGTIALYMAKYGCEILDVGVPVLGMHSPYEITSKVDVYSTYLAYKAFLKN